jgi:hypothetical protein
LYDELAARREPTWTLGEPVDQRGDGLRERATGTPYKQEVAGSNPAPPTNNQPAKPVISCSRGPRFSRRIPRQFGLSANSCHFAGLDERPSRSGSDG